MKGDKPTGQLCYKSQIGQENVGIDGGFVPYIKDEKAKTLTFKRSRIKLTDAGIEFYIWDKKTKTYGLRTTASFHPEVKDGGSWKQKTSTVSKLAWSENSNDTHTDKANVEYLISTNDMDARVNIEVGGNSKALFSFEIKSKVAAEQRLIWQTDEKEEAVPIQAFFDASKNKQTRTIGYKFTGYEIRWNYAEAVERKAEGIAAEEDTKIIIAEKAYTLGKVERISPDTWGETGITDTNDDCDEDSVGVDLDGYDSDGIACGYMVSNGAHDLSLRFQNVTIAGSPTSIDAGTQIECDVPWSIGSWTFRVFGLEGDTPAFNATDPSTRTKTTNYADFGNLSEANDQVVDGVDFRALVKEILDTSWSSGYDLGITFDHNGVSSTSYQMQIEDVSTAGGGTAAARLTIVYTAAGGDVSVDATSDPLVITENTVTISADTSLQSGFDALVITENTVATKADSTVQAGFDALIVTPASATVSTVANVDVSATTDALIITANAATVDAEINIASTTDVLNITENQAGVNAETNVNVSIDPLILTALAALIVEDTNLQAGYDSLVVTGNTAIISTGAGVTGKSWMKRHLYMIADYEHL